MVDPAWIATRRAWPRGDAVDVWYLWLPALPPSLLARADEILSAEEVARAAAFRFSRDAIRYRGAHVLLRLLLADYLARAPEDVVINPSSCHHCSGDHGKPSLALPGCEFSLSHAGSLVAFAFASVPVGIDVEVVGRAAEVVDQLHREERRQLALVPAGELARAASQCWVRKEAYLKGTGAGLGGGLDGVYVGIGGEPEGEGPELGGWRLVDLAVPSGYTAALALRGQPDPDPRWLFAERPDGL